MESPGNSNGQRTISGSPGRAEQGVAGIPPGMDAHLSGAPCQSGCQGFVGQGLSAGSFQQGFLNSDPWANWINQRQFYDQQLLLQQQLRDAQSVPVPPSVSSTLGKIWIVLGPPGRMFCMIFMLTFYLAQSQRTRNKRATILAHPQIHLSLLA